MMIVERMATGFRVKLCLKTGRRKPGSQPTCAAGYCSLALPAASLASFNDEAVNFSVAVNAAWVITHNHQAG